MQPEKSAEEKYAELLRPLLVNKPVSGSPDEYAKFYRSVAMLIAKGFGNESLPLPPEEKPK